MKYRVIELFAGVGGFRVGLNNIKSFNNKSGRAIEKNSNWDFVWANQWEPSTKTQPAFDCYTTRFGHENVSNEDISLVDKKTIPDHDLLVGGFPCQDYSVARSTSNEMGIEGKKGVLWWEIADIIKEKKPKVILLENVDRLLKSPASQRGRDFAIMLKTLDRLGYIVNWRMINAGEYNMPQRRKRVFILATKNDLKYAKETIDVEKNIHYFSDLDLFNKTFPIDKESISITSKDLSMFKDEVDVTNNYKLGKFLSSGIYCNGKTYETDVIEVTASKIYTLGDVIKKSKKYTDDYSNYKIEGEVLEKWEYLKGNKRIPRVKPNGEHYFYSEGQMAFPDSLNKPGRTMLTSEATSNRSSHIILDEDLGAYRKITEVEAETLQMFPPNWTNTGMTSRQRYFMMGNALVTGVVFNLSEEIYRILEDIEEE